MVAAALKSAGQEESGTQEEARSQEESRKEGCEKASQEEIRQEGGKESWQEGRQENSKEKRRQTPLRIRNLMSAFRAQYNNRAQSGAVYSFAGVWT